MTINSFLIVELKKKDSWATSSS